MKKHSPREVPDFARHPTRMSDGGHAGAPLHTRAAEPDHRPASRDTAAPPARVKPHATSQKSGRRGQ